MTESLEIWIKAGYETFALTGLSSLKIEPLAKKVGKNKSSFYHYFADIELFVDPTTLGASTSSSVSFTIVWEY